MQGHWVELIFVSGRHIHKRFPSSTHVFHAVLNSGFQIKRFDQSSLLEGLGVANSLDIDPFRVAANAQLRVLADSLFNDISNVLEGGRKLLHFIEAKRDVVCDVALVTAYLKRLSKFVFGLFVFLFFVENAALGDDGFC